MAMIGNDPQDMAELVAKLAQAIEQITTAMGNLDGKAQSVRWEGPDANRFKGTTWPASKKQLTSVINSLTEVKQVVNQQKQQQINASS